MKKKELFCFFKIFRNIKRHGERFSKEEQVNKKEEKVPDRKKKEKRPPSLSPLRLFGQVALARRPLFGEIFLRFPYTYTIRV